jgi:hypothetical protein
MHYTKQRMHNPVEAEVQALIFENSFGSNAIIYTDGSDMYEAHGPTQRK